MNRLLAALLAAALLVAAPACSRDKGSKEAFCEQVAKVPALDSVVQGFADADPDELTERLDGAKDSYAALASSAPGDIRGDVAQVDSLVEVVTDAVAEHHDDPEAVTSEIRDAMADHQGADEASKRVAAYAERTCGVELNPAVKANP